jgi:hypothetical protein
MYKVLGGDQKVYGPATAAQLRQWMAEGRIHFLTLAQLEGTTEWKPLSTFGDFAVPPPLVMPPPARSEGNGMALAGLICGIMSIVCCCFAPLFGILGLVFSIIVLSRREGCPADGARHMALAGLVLSVLGLLCHMLLPMLYLGRGRWIVRHYPW